MLKLVNMQSRGNTKKRIKICYVVTKGVWGGAQKYVYSLATNLSKDKYEAIVVCGDGDELPEKLKLAGIETHRLHTLKRDISAMAEMKNFWALLKILNREKPNVLHLNSPKAGGLGALAGRLYNIFKSPESKTKIIYTAHGWPFNEDRNILSKSLIFIFSCITGLLCHKVIVIAKREKEQATLMPFLDNAKIVLIRNGIEKMRYRDRSIVREALLSRIGKTKLDKRIWIGSLAELHRNKGYEYAISAMADIKTPFIYFIFGKGEEREHLEWLIVHNNLQDKVFLLGFIENAHLYMKAFDIFLLTSVKEGLPYTLLEAGQVGLPIIASGVGGIPDIIDDGENGILVRKGNVSQITKAVSYYITHPEKRTEFGKKIKAKVEKEFSIEGMIKKTEKLYK